jgi:hypothetical protein
MVAPVVHGIRTRSVRAVVVLVALALCAAVLLLEPSGPAHAGTTASASTATTALLPLRAPKHYVPPQGAKFNHWNIKKYRWVIRRHMLRTIDSTPRGATIRWMVFSFGDWKIEQALVRARNRGVSVQVLANYKNRETWAPWRKLQAQLGTRTTKSGRNPERLSWARQCKRSCRGWGGNLHVKLYLFSQVATATNVTMYGSWNPTWVANERQWNHLDTRWDPATYQHYLSIFAQAKRDRPYGYAHWMSGGMEHMVFPRPSTRASNDPMNIELGKIACVIPPDVATQTTHRTVVRVGMYVFGGSRGTYMAKRIRSLWNQGCDVAIIYGFMSDRALSILNSPSGRGRIPMKQAVKYENGKPYRYLHHKFVAVHGMYDAHLADVVWAGSTNFSNLGFSADDMTVRTSSPMSLAAPVRQAYFKDFAITWRGPNVRRPHGGLSNPEARGTKPSQKLRAPLGQGVYSELEAD